ncbi:MAG TPA: hypothetical protein VEC12_06605 [Bacteroidia bacterium]|nr:hypothetical protein [Bacteroidia bacterium]
MVSRFICLANSLKRGGRCIAGILVNEKNQPLLENGKPKWIRPITHTDHGELPENLTRHIKLLDIVEIEITGTPEEVYHQGENVFFKDASLCIKGAFEKENLASFCDNRDRIFGGKGKAVAAEDICQLGHSLVMVKTPVFNFAERCYNDSPKKQVRAVFTYHANEYDLPVTDPVFLSLFKQNKEFFNNYKRVYLCLSLGINWENWHYKLAAGVILG